MFLRKLACEQALCLGKNSEEREGRGAFPSPHPARLKACSQAIRKQTGGETEKTRESITVLNH